MQASQKLSLLSLLLTVKYFTTSVAQHTSSTFCGNIEIKEPFLNPNSTVASPLSRMLMCKAQKLYFRTSLGLFPVSSIDFTTKTLIISHPSCSSSIQYISPSHLAAGFPSPPQANSLLLFHCSRPRNTDSQLIRNCSRLHACGAAEIQDQEPRLLHSCLIVQDVEKLDTSFHPKDLSCSGYRRVHHRALSDVDHEEVELGTRVSFDIPNHVPDLCNECLKPNGNCGVGLRCICHAKECKDKVIEAAAAARSLKAHGNIVVSFISLIVMMNFWMDARNFERS